MSSSSDPVEPRLPLSGAGLWRMVRPLLARLLRLRALWVVFGAWLLFEILGASCTTYVPPNMMAIKQVYFGAARRHAARTLRPRACTSASRGSSGCTSSPPISR